MKGYSVEIEIDEVPPTMNTMYPTSRQGRRYLSKKGKEFKEYVQFHLLNLINTKRIKPFGDKRVCMYYEFHFKGKRKRDTSNYVKAMEDSFTGLLFDDDEQVDDFRAKRFYHAEYNHTVIKAYELKEVA